MRLEWEIAMWFALDLLGTFTRQDFALFLAGVRKTPSGRELDRLLDRWRQQQIVTRIGRGRNVQFRITDKALDRVHGTRPDAEWDRGWDGKWRVFSFDIPMRNRKERIRLWRHLHAARFGFLQRSVWIWPHDVEDSLRHMVEAHGINAPVSHHLDDAGGTQTRVCATRSWRLHKNGDGTPSSRSETHCTPASLRRFASEWCPDSVHSGRTADGSAALRQTAAEIRDAWTRSHHGLARL